MADQLPVLHVRLATLDEDGQPTAWQDIRIDGQILDRAIGSDRAWRTLVDQLARVMWAEYISPMLAVDGNSWPPGRR